jgi:hypothetical protein
VETATLQTPRLGDHQLPLLPQLGDVHSANLDAYVLPRRKFCFALALHLLVFKPWFGRTNITTMYVLPGSCALGLHVGQVPNPGSGKHLLPLLPQLWTFILRNWLPTYYHDVSSAWFSRHRFGCFSVLDLLVWSILSCHFCSH